MTAVPASARRHKDPALARLELTVLRRLDGLLQGDYSGLLPGPGSEFGDARVYQAGDDVRRMDWSVTARTSEPHVRDAIADRELELIAVVDSSASLAFGTTGRGKRELARDLAGAFVVMGMRHGNRVGAVLAGDGPRWIPPRGGAAHTLALLTEIGRAESKACNLADALKRTRRLARRRGMVVVVSDFLVDAGWQRELQALATRHDVVAVEVLDRRELALPDVGYVTLVDAETGKRRVVDTTDAAVRLRFAQRARARRDSIARDIAGTGSDHLRVQTGVDWVAAVARFAQRRRMRRTAAARRP